MRKIKFRGKREDNKEWVYGNLIETDEGNYLIIEQSTFPEACIKEIEQYDLQIYKVIPETVGQYIEMTDIRGNEIFDGDIIKLYRPNGKVFSDVPVAYVFYNNGAWRISGFERFPFMPDIISSFTFKYEVIGNIHDNPELLNDKS